MLTHKQIWSAIDALAAKNRLSPSGLAKLAGLDPTTFNKSKRGAPNGKLRWPSTESISKVLAATGASLEDFVALVGRDGGAPRTRAARAAGRHGAGRQPRLLRRCRISRRRGLGRNPLSRSRRRACLCAGDHRRFHAAGLSRRRPHRRFARRQRAPRRPRGGEDPWRRSDGQAADAPTRRSAWN